MKTTDGTDGAAGSPSLVSTTLDAAGVNCVAGGISLSVGTNTNLNGVLEIEEVQCQTYLCNG